MMSLVITILKKMKEEYYSCIILGSLLGAAVFNLNLKFLTSEILKMTSSEIPSRSPGKLFRNSNFNSGKSNLRRWKRAGSEKCDDGNTANSDGCSSQRQCCYSNCDGQRICSQIALYKLSY